MVRTFEEADEKGSGEPADGGEWDTVVDIDFDGEHLEDKWKEVLTILSTESPGDRPNLPEENRLGALQNPGFNVDLEGLGNQGLLTLMVRSNLAILRTLFDVANGVEPANILNITGIQQVTEAEEPKEIVPSAGGENATTKYVILKADEDNDAPIYIGNDDVDPTEGYKLRKGQFLSLDFNFASSSLYMTAEETGPEMQILGFR